MFKVDPCSMASWSQSLKDQRIRAFLEKQKQPETQQRYKRLALYTREACEALLTSMSIKGVVLSRTKKYDSLEKKMKGLAQDPEFREWLSDTWGDIDAHPEMGDLAGVRIGLYLPGDVLKVARAIRERFKIKHVFGTVRGGREATEGRNVEIENHMNGPWHSQDLNGADEYWEHYGYKSWQMVVALKAPMPEGLSSLRVEIQVGTVVTQASAEVQHNIIYKRPTDMISSPAMKRMIDAINGLAITTDIVLKELERNIEVAKMEARQRSKTTFTAAGFKRWFELTYKSQMWPEERERWDCNLAWAEFMITEGPRHRLHACPAYCQKLIEDRRLLELGTQSPEKVDIAQHILRAVGYTGQGPDAFSIYPYTRNNRE